MRLFNFPLVPAHLSNCPFWGNWKNWVGVIGKTVGDPRLYLRFEIFFDSYVEDQPFYLYTKIREKIIRNKKIILINIQKIKNSYSIAPLYSITLNVDYLT